MTTVNGPAMPPTALDVGPVVRIAVCFDRAGESVLFTASRCRWSGPAIVPVEDVELFNIEFDGGDGARLAIILTRSSPNGDELGFGLASISPAWQVAAYVHNGRPAIAVVSRSSRIAVFARGEFIAACSCVEPGNVPEPSLESETWS